MAESNGSNISNRLDRIERIVEVLANSTADLAHDVKIVLRAQVVMSDHFEKLTKRMDELATAQKHADERMDALILTVDEIVRGRKRES